MSSALDAAILGLGIGFGAVIGLGLIEFLRYRFTHVFRSPEELRQRRRRPPEDETED